MQTLLNEQFPGSSLDSSTWTVTAGACTVASNSVYGNGGAFNISTEGKKTFSAANTLVIEFATMNASNDDINLAIFDVNNPATNYIGFYCNENYYNQGIRIDFAGVFGSGYTNTGAATTAKKYYKITLDGTTVKIERGPSYGNYSELTLTRTAAVSTSGYTFHVRLATSINAGSTWYPVTIQTNDPPANGNFLQLF